MMKWRCVMDGDKEREGKGKREREKEGERASHRLILSIM